RTDGTLGKRLDGFNLSILDDRRDVVFARKGLMAPEKRALYEVSGEGSEGPIRRAAMTALTFVRGQEAQAFRAIAPFVRDNVDRHTAIRALQRIPAAYWPPEEARPLLDSII